MEQPVEQEKEINRRSFLSLATWSIAGLIGAGLSVPAIAYLVGPALKQEAAQNWLRLGPSSKVDLSTPTLFKVTIQRQTGWILNEEEFSVYILTENGRDYIAMSNICTHLGCRVRWISDQESFFCPCHNAVFSKDGSVVSGPPPRPLDRYEVKVEEDQLFVKAG
jgi:Rieske Fe-S protein